LCYGSHITQLISTRLKKEIRRWKYTHRSNQTAYGCGQTKYELMWPVGEQAARQTGAMHTCWITVRCAL